MVKKTALASILTLTLGLSAADVALACSCAPAPAPAEARDQADAVFTGTVVEITPDRSGNYSVVRFQVQQVWKGTRCREVTVTTGLSDLNCGYAFQTGQTYLVYAYSEKGKLNTNMCSRTKPVSEAGEDLSALGAPSEVCTAG